MINSFLRISASVTHVTNEFSSDGSTRSTSGAMQETHPWRVRSALTSARGTTTAGVDTGVQSLTTKSRRTLNAARAAHHASGGVPWREVGGSLGTAGPRTQGGLTGHSTLTAGARATKEIGGERRMRATGIQTPWSSGLAGGVGRMTPWSHQVTRQAAIATVRTVGHVRSVSPHSVSLRCQSQVLHDELAVIVLDPQRVPRRHHSHARPTSPLSVLWTTARLPCLIKKN